MCLQRTRRTVSAKRWFDFDDLNFKSGSAELTDSSLHQVQNIVTILKAYPKLKIKLVDIPIEQAIALRT